MNFKPVYLVLIVTAACLAVSAQGTFTPRDADEAEGWAIYVKYKESKRTEAQLESYIKQKFNDSMMGAHGYMAIFGADREAAAEVTAKKTMLDAERKRQADLEAAWDKKFYWRYGDLRWCSEMVRDPKTGRNMDRLEFALIYFPFDYRKVGVPTTNERSAATGIAEKGNAESWSHIRVTMTPVSGFKTEDKPGWRNNGTGFTASTSGGGPLTLKIDITGKGGVSYYDYTANVNVRTSSGRTIIAETRKISTNGGTVSFSTSVTPASNDVSLSVNVSIAGGNPENFIYYVSGTVGLSGAVGSVSERR